MSLFAKCGVCGHVYKHRVNAIYFCPECHSSQIEGLPFVMDEAKKKEPKSAAKRAFTLELVKAIYMKESATHIETDIAEILMNAKAVADACEKEGLL